MSYHIFPAKDTDFERVYTMMEDAFPPNEMRTKEKQMELFTTRKNYHVICLGNERKNEEVFAFIIVWDITGYIFIENFAVDSSVRGKGFGGLLLDWVVEEFKKPVLLEVEPPVDTMTKRRVGFYQGHNFHLCDEDYLMPPLREGDKFFPLKLMRTPNAITKEEFRPIQKLIYREVYDRV